MQVSINNPVWASFETVGKIMPVWSLNRLSHNFITSVKGFDLQQQI